MPPVPFAASTSASSHFGAARASILPREALGLRDFIRRIKNQGPTNSCVGQALSSAFDLRLRKLGFSLPDPSGLGLYCHARVLARVGTEPLVDEGSNADYAFAGAKEIGIPSEDVWPMDPSKVNVELPMDVLAEASTMIIAAWLHVYQQGKDRVDVAAQALDKGYSVVFAMGVDMAFVNYSGGTIDAIDLEHLVGGHMLLIVGYRTRPDGAREFLVQNSWGEGWGEGGFCWVHETVLAAPNASGFSVVEVQP